MPASTSPSDRLLRGSPLRHRRTARRIAVALATALVVSLAVILLTVLSLGPAGARLFVEGLVLSALLSIVPAAILWYLDRRERESPWLFAVAILWGGCIATGLALPLNSGIILGVQRWLELHPDTGTYLGPNGALLLGAPLAGPLVEEAMKGLGVVLLFWLIRAEFDNVRDGFVYGALVGVGFNLLEAPLYVAQGYKQFGSAAWGLQFGTRFALFGLAGHAMFTGIFGAFLGWARETTRGWVRWWAPIFGLLLAILAHALNNSLALIVTILLRSEGKDIPAPAAPPPVSFLDAWIGGSVRNLILFLPFVLVLLVALRRSGRSERRVIVEELRDEVGGAVTRDEYEAIQADRVFHTRRIDHVDREHSAALVNAQNELAFRKHRVRRDGGDPGTDPLVAGWRREIAALRV